MASETSEAIDAPCTAETDDPDPEGCSSETPTFRWLRGRLQLIEESAPAATRHQEGRLEEAAIGMDHLRGRY
jgi:hypothetical protein